MMMVVPLPRTPLHKTRSLTRCQQLNAEGSITHLAEVKQSVAWEWSGLKWGCLSGDIQGLLKTEGQRHQSNRQETQQVPIDALTLEASMSTKRPTTKRPTLKRPMPFKSPADSSRHTSTQGY